MIKNRPFQDPHSLENSTSNGAYSGIVEHDRPLRIVRSALRAEPRSVEFDRPAARGAAENSRMRYG